MEEVRGKGCPGYCAFVSDTGRTTGWGGHMCGQSARVPRANQALLKSTINRVKWYCCLPEKSLLEF